MQQIKKIKHSKSNNQIIPVLQKKKTIISDRQMIEPINSKNVEIVLKKCPNKSCAWSQFSLEDIDFFVLNPSNLLIFLGGSDK